MQRKNISLSGYVENGKCPLTVMDFSKQDLFIYTKNIVILGILVGKKEFIGIEDDEFIEFQDGISFELEDGKRVALFGACSQLEIRRI